MQLEMFDFPVLIWYELSFMISPPLRIRNYIKKEKYFTFREFGKFKSVNYPAHISIGKPRKLYLENEIEEFLAGIRDSLLAIPAFYVQFDGFEYFPGSNTIYAKIVNTEDIIRVFKAIFTSHPPVPHMTIAESLTHEQFQYAWKYFQNKEYKDQFLCDHILVLKKKADSNGPWEQHGKISLLQYL